VFVWRNALILGIGFVVVGVGYYLVQGTGTGLDLAGATLLVVLGLSMAFTFAILLRGSREL
jgi:hypothetical protein